MENQLDIFLNQKNNLDVSQNDPLVWCVFVDGAARGNPGNAGAGIYVTQKHDNVEIIKKGFFLGHKTNNQAEYLALLLAIFLIKEKQEKFALKNINLNIKSDSELLVKQMCGTYKVRNETLQHIQHITKNLLKNFSYKFVHIMREKNKIADKLANLGIDKKNPLPQNFLDFVTNFDDIVGIM